MRNNKEKGITLVALIITIIVMLILVGVSVQIVINTGLIGKTKEATDQTKIAYEQEKNYGETITIDNVIYKDMEDYMNQVLDDDLEGNEHLKKFVTKWNVAEGETIVLPIYEKQEASETVIGDTEIDFTYNFIVDYGDGTEPVQVTSYDDVNGTHTYSQAGEYKISITGICEGWSFNAVPTSAEKITEIEQWGVVNAKKIDFRNCINLVGRIPSPAKNSFKEIISLKYLFNGCQNLTSQLPENILYNATNLITVNNFVNASGITGKIPENLLRDCVNLQNAAYVCAARGITGSIPEDLFKNCTELLSLSNAFGNAGVSGTIPEDLLKYCTKLTTVKCLFRNCANLNGSIPENLFVNCPEITEFYQTFDGCQNLIGSVPQDIFSNNRKVKDYRMCFRNCTGLKDSTIKFYDTSNLEYKTGQFCTGVNATFTLLIPRGQNRPCSEANNIVFEEYD